MNKMRRKKLKHQTLSGLKQKYFIYSLVLEDRNVNEVTVGSSATE